MTKLFLAKIKDTDDRDAVNYLEFEGFVCEHYFSGLHIVGPCFSNNGSELKELVENNFDELETILTKEEFLKLFELDEKLDALGFGIEKDSPRYLEGMKILEEYENTIGNKLKSKENADLFDKVIKEEKEFLINEYNLTNSDVEEIFDNYGKYYQDRSIVGCVFSNKDELVEEEKFNYGYDNMPYFDDEKFCKDLLDSDNYLELESGKIVSYNY